jgi:hypothetical protein
MKKLFFFVHRLLCICLNSGHKWFRHLLVNKDVPNFFIRSLFQVKFSRSSPGKRVGLQIRPSFPFDSHVWQDNVDHVNNVLNLSACLNYLIESLIFFSVFISFETQSSIKFLFSLKFCITVWYSSVDPSDIWLYWNYSFNTKFEISWNMILCCSYPSYNVVKQIIKICFAYSELKSLA